MAKKTVFDLMKGCPVRVVFHDGKAIRGVLKDFDVVNNIFGDAAKVEFILIKEDFTKPITLHIIPTHGIRNIEMETDEDDGSV